MANHRQSTTTSGSINPSSLLSPRQSLLRDLTLSTLAYSPQSALFYAERLYALDASVESSVYLVALVHSKLDQPHEALHILRQPITFSPFATSDYSTPASPEDPFGYIGGTAGGGGGPASRSRWTTTSTGKLSRPAIEASVRCARLYGQICTTLGRDKEGRQVLFRVIQPGTPLAPISPQDPLTNCNAVPSSSVVTMDESTAIDLELARLARKGGEPERAVQSYSKVINRAPLCWEALESLCQLGHAPSDFDTLYPPPKPRPSATTTTTTHPPPLHQQQSAAPPASYAVRSHPAPLGPAQNSSINAPFSFGRPRNGDFHETPLNYSTPAAGVGGVELKGGMIGFGGGGHLVGGAGGMLKGKGKESWLIGGGHGGLPLKRTASGRNGDITDSSIDEQSFNNSFYPGQPLFAAPITSQIPRPPITTSTISSSASSSLFTPPTMTSLPTTTAPGVKRTRAGNIAPASLNGGNEDESGQGIGGARGKRVVRGVPGESKSRNKGSANVVADAPVTRRSSRLSRDTGSSNGIGSVGMTSSRSQSSATGGGGGSVGSGGGGIPKSAHSRDKKRSKANTGPSVLSDTASGSDALSPRSRGSSPVPSSPGGSTAAPSSASGAFDPARQEAEDYVAILLRSFGQALVAQSKYDNARVLQVLGTLPSEQQRSTRCLVSVGRAHFEGLDYDKAEKAFSHARSLSPHLLVSMDYYSTTLWHLRLPTPLALLSQELMLLAPNRPSSWIATGNTFSLNSDHSSALKCFKRAVQLDQDCVYAYTLAGHECVMLEEWERATGFFREAVRRDSLHYNAWFGLGNVYMKTGKYTLAEYHFRRALEINPSNATLVCCVGSVLEKSRRYKEALDMYERACVLAPESPLARFRRVRMMFVLGKNQLAESDLVQLKSLAPLEPTVHYLLGKLYKSLGPSKRAAMLAAFTTAQDLEPRMASVIREQIESSAQEGMEVDSELGSIA